LECSVEFDGKDLAITMDGVKVAVRENAAWVVIEPGWKVEEDKGKRILLTHTAGNGTVTEYEIAVRDAD
jgi:hypothetical protein